MRSRKRNSLITPPEVTMVNLFTGSVLKKKRGLSEINKKTFYGSRSYYSYLVDPASSHMLVSKIKPCMSKYKQLYSETANGSLNQLSFI